MSLSWCSVFIIIQHSPTVCEMYRFYQELLDDDLPFIVNSFKSVYNLSYWILLGMLLQMMSNDSPYNESTRLIRRAACMKMCFEWTCTLCNKIWQAVTKPFSNALLLLCDSRLSFEIGDEYYAFKMYPYFQRKQSLS